MENDQTKLTVLLLEDQAFVRKALRAWMQLSNPHAIIHEAGTYEEAVQNLATNSIDLAFLDVDLKGAQSGLDVLRHIREAGLSTRAIMLSARTDEATVMGAIRAGASGYIPKDAESDGIVERAIDTVFKGGIFLPSEVIGKGGFSPSTIPLSAGALEGMGIRGRPLEALYYLCQGLTTKLIAYKMGVSESTVANDYNTKLFRKFKVHNRASLIVEVSRLGIIVPVPKITS